MYMVDKEGELLNGEWCFEIHEDYETDSTKIKDKNNPKMAWWLRRLNMDYLKKQPKEFRFWRRIDGSCWKILASTDKSLGLPLLPVILAKAKKYTEEDIKNAIKYGVDTARESLTLNKRFEGFKQSLNPLPKQVEVSLLEYNMLPKTDITGIIQVKRWIYE